MTDLEFAALFMTQVKPAMQAQPGLAAVQMARNYQPRQHGASNSPYVYFFKIGDHRHGHVLRKDAYNVGDEQFDHTEMQVYETTYQFSAWIPQDPNNVTRLTESDILNVVAGVMQSDAIISAFRAQGVGILRVTEVRNPYIVDDRNQFEAIPTFDVVLTHKRISVSTIPAVVTYDLNMSRV